MNGRVITVTILLLAAASAGQAGAQTSSGVMTSLAALGGLRLRLASDWPELGDGAKCSIGGQEQVVGEVRRTASGSYEGDLVREGQLVFCGRHAGLTSSCSVTVEARGPVHAVGSIRMEPDGGRILVLRWAPDGAGNEAVTRGSCPIEFARRLGAMYGRAGRLLEIPLLADSGGRVNPKLADQGWNAAVEEESASTAGPAVPGGR